ncbi:MAG: choice-of-anchor N protein [bacterium]
MRTLKILTLLKKALCSLALVFLWAGVSWACPTLQLDIAGGTYNYSGNGQTEDTIVAPGDTFTLYAFLIPNSSNKLNDTYYISAAIVPKVGEPGENLGSFVFSGETINVTSGMTYGIPPLEIVVTQTQLWDRGDLPRHGIYYTYFAEFGFKFNESQYLASYDTALRAQNNLGIPPDSTGVNMYYVTFQVDVSGLAPGYIIHFDLYNTTIRCGNDVDVTKFAPFSHDAESKVPETSSLFLLGAGLLGVGLLAKRRRPRRLD